MRWERWKVRGWTLVVWLMTLTFLLIASGAEGKWD